MTFDIDELPYVPARLQKKNPGRAIDVIVWHSTEAKEGLDTAENVARWFQDARAKGSAHVTADVNSAVRSVPDANQAAHAPGANTNGLGLELAGLAGQTREQWLDDYSKATIDNGANIAAQWHRKYNVPRVYLTYHDLRAGKRGWTTHHQISLAFGKSTHWDPGPGFPNDYAQERIDAHYLGIPDDQGEDDLDARQSKMFDEMYYFLIGPDVPAAGDKNPRHNAMVTRLGYLFGESIGSPDALKNFRELFSRAIKDSDNVEQLLEKVGKLEEEILELAKDS